MLHVRTREGGSGLGLATCRELVGIVSGTGRDAMSQLAHTQVDMVLLDCNLPDIAAARNLEADDLDVVSDLFRFRAGGVGGRMAPPMRPCCRASVRRYPA